MTSFPIPNPPTDNLYKFYSIAGIVITIFSLTTILVSSFTLEKQIRELNLFEKKVEIDSLNFKSQLNNLDNKLLDLNDKLESYPLGDNKEIYSHENYLQKLIDLQKDPEWRNYLEFFYKYEDHIIPGKIEIKEINSIKNEMKILAHELDIKQLELRLTRENLKSERMKLRVIYCFGIVLIIGGVLLSIFGFKLWNSRVQKFLDEKQILELKILKSELEKESKK
jgi:hypothetical protein